jgi:hypothetical protein
LSLTKCSPICSRLDGHKFFLLIYYESQAYSGVTEVTLQVGGSESCSFINSSPSLTTVLKVRDAYIDIFYNAPMIVSKRVDSNKTKKNWF